MTSTIDPGLLARIVSHAVVEALKQKEGVSEQEEDSKQNKKKTTPSEKKKAAEDDASAVAAMSTDAVGGHAVEEEVRCSPSWGKSHEALLHCIEKTRKTFLYNSTIASQIQGLVNCIDSHIKTNEPNILVISGQLLLNLRKIKNGGQEAADQLHKHLVAFLYSVSRSA